MTCTQSRRGLLAGAASLVASTAWRPRRARAQTGAPDRLPVRIINSSSTMELAFEALMKRQGYLEEMGLAPTTVFVSDGSKILASLISGEMDICTKAGFGPVLPAVARGGPVKVIAGAALLTPQGVLTNDAGLRSAADLVGRKIGTGPIGALEHQLMVAILLKHGVDPASVVFVDVGTTTEIFRAVSAGVVDAGPVNIDVYDRVKGKLKIIADFWTELPEFPFQGSFASIEALKSKREAIVRTLAAYCKLYRYLETDESRGPYVAAYLAAVGSGASAADGERQWRFLHDNKVFATNLVIPDKSLEFIQNLNLRTHVQRTALPLSSFSDMSLAREAAARLG